MPHRSRAASREQRLSGAYTWSQPVLSALQQAGDRSMNATVEQVLLTKIKALSPQQVAEVAFYLGLAIVER